MTDAQSALAQVREALAAGPTPGPWVTMPANAGVHCVARINAWEAVPPSDCELSHDSIDASFIAACSPANMTAILAHVEAQAAEIERLTAERDNARERCERTANLLVGIHALLCPPPLTLADGRTLVFRPKNPDPHTVLQTLSDRIRALPDEIAAINDAKEQK